MQKKRACKLYEQAFCWMQLKRENVKVHTYTYNAYMQHAAWLLECITICCIVYAKHAINSLLHIGFWLHIGGSHIVHWALQRYQFCQRVFFFISLYPSAMTEFAHDLQVLMRIEHQTKCVQWKSIHNMAKQVCRAVHSNVRIVVYAYIYVHVVGCCTFIHGIAR